MIKVLLVDDEVMALENLESIVSWEDYGFQLIGVTTDSDKALALYKKYKPELVISDVKMPGMNGIELVNAIRECGGQSHILFLSAYKSFDYIKQAIRLNIDDYMLKSDLEDESFLKKILLLKDTIEIEKAQKSYTLGTIIKEIFIKNQPEESYRKILDGSDFIRIYKKYYYVILAKKDAPKILDKYFIINREDYEYEFYNACNNAAQGSEVQVITVFPFNESEYIAVIDMNNHEVSQKEVMEKLHYYSRAVFHKMNLLSDQKQNIYYYSKRMSARQFGRFYTENRKQLSLRYLKKKNEILEFDEADLLERDLDKIKSITADELNQIMKNKNVDALHSCIQTMKIAVAEEDCFSYLWYVKNFFEAISYFSGSLSGERSGRKFSLTEGSVSYDFSDPEQLISFLEYKIDEIMFMLVEGEKKVYSSVIANAIQFIRDVYHDPDLSANMVAVHVNISASWLSTKFKEEVGTGVSEYINGVRIDHAKRLFQEKDLMIYEVSESVGFTSSQYFSKIFKEYVGLTPNQYRRIITNEKVRS